MRAQLLLCLATLYCSTRAAAFRNGDFVQTARKAQFHEVNKAHAVLMLSLLHPPPPLTLTRTSHIAFAPQSRTQWHDLLGHHCPRFGIDRLVSKKTDGQGFMPLNLHIPPWDGIFQVEQPRQLLSLVCQCQSQCKNCCILAPSQRSLTCQIIQVVHQ